MVHAVRAPPRPRTLGKPPRAAPLELRLRHPFLPSAPPPPPAAAAGSPDGPRPAPGPALKGAAPPLYVTAGVRTDRRTSGWMSTGMDARTGRLTAEQRQAPGPTRCTGDAGCPALPKSLLPGQEHLEVKPRQIREAFPK
ncbi:proline-rich transmembrane protein 1-like [Pyrgilauda ruficollis]|uniref:proline-rich transmembrane protein 1-like n=1 Tax=Pyrgilauda ruficollis TaxID=221976 RepID=UPI001B873E14|nr:proline-rich transmembrane protein 1-like [Pyrgilauda ruficollis]